MENQLINIESKLNKLTELKLEQLECAKQAMYIANKGSSKYPKVNMNRAFRIVGWAIKARQIQVYMRLVEAQPIFPSEGLPIVGA